MKTNKTSSADSIWTNSVQWPYEIHSQVCLWIKVTMPHTQLLITKVIPLLHQHDIKRELSVCMNDSGISADLVSFSPDASDILIERRETVGARHRSTA